MKKSVLILVGILLAVNCFSQAGNWAWAKTSEEVTQSGNFTDWGSAIVADHLGNTYISGIFHSSTITFGTIVLTNSGTNNTMDIYLAKYNINGNCMWARSMGTNSDDNVASIATDSSGNIYLTGMYRNSPMNFGTTTLTNPNGINNIFLVKYDSLGNVVWAKGAGENDAISGTVITDAIGNIYIAGCYYDSTITFGSTTLINSTNRLDIFIAKYDSNGNALWAKSAQGLNSNSNGASSITTDATGNIYLTGAFDGTSITFGSTTLLNSNSVIGMHNIFITKYDNTGNVLWVRGAGGVQKDWANSIAADVSGIYIVGGFMSSSITFGASTLVNTDTAVGNHSDAFIAKYDFAGNPLWAKSAGSENFDNSYSIATDASGVYVSGIFDDSTIVFDNITLSGLNYNNMFVVKYSSSGAILCATSLLRGNSRGESGVSTDKLGNAYFTSSYNISPFIVGTNILTPLNTGWSAEIFVAKYNCDVVSNEGINEQDFQSTLSLFPNPTTGTFEIKSNYKIESIKIMDVMGREINGQWIIENGQCNVNMNEVSKGIYFLQVKTEKGMENRKIIIK